MKKLFFSAALLLIGVTTFAQGTYFRPTVGYTFRASATDFPGTSIDLTGEEYLSGTVGRGLKIGGAFGKMFNEHVGAEIGINYFHGADETFAEVAIPGVNETEVTARAWAISLSPTMVITSGGEGLAPYARVGVVVPVGGRLLIDTKANVAGQVDIGTGTPVAAQINLNETEEVSPQFSLGYRCALGVTYPLNESLSFFGELEFVSFTVKGEGKEVTEFLQTIEVSEQTIATVTLADLPTAEREVNLVDKLTASSNVEGRDNFDENQRADELTDIVNLGGVGINVGVRFNF